MNGSHFATADDDDAADPRHHHQDQLREHAELSGDGGPHSAESSAGRFLKPRSGPTDAADVSDVGGSRFSGSMAPRRNQTALVCFGVCTIGSRRRFSVSVCGKSAPLCESHYNADIL